jgi:hypothetical protein
MKIMTTHSSATARAEKPHVDRPTRTNTIINALKRRAQAVLNDETIDAQSRAIIRYALETNDPWLAKLVRRADAGESLIDADGFLQTADTDEAGSSEEKIKALAEIICRDGVQSSAALFVLMATLENAAHPKAIANNVKYFAFTCCGELNLCGIVDAQVAVLERELFAGNTL